MREYLWSGSGFRTKYTPPGLGVGFGTKYSPSSMVSKYPWGGSVDHRGAASAVGAGLDAVQHITQAQKRLDGHSKACADRVFDYTIPPAWPEVLCLPACEDKHCEWPFEIQEHRTFAKRVHYIMRINYGRLLNLLRRLAHRLLLPR